MKDNKNLLSVVILTSVACVIFLTCATLWGLFDQTELLPALKVVADSFTIPGVLYVGATLLGWVGSKGMFDIFGYSIGGLFHLLKRESYDKRQETFYDYRVKKDADRKPFNWQMLWVGLAFLLLAVVTTVLFSCLS
jgi:hypothetical protein